MDFSSLVKDAWDGLPQAYVIGETALWSEGDLLCELYTLCKERLLEEGFLLPLPLHAEITVSGKEPDLVLGHKEVVVELKFGTIMRGSSQLNKELREVADKLRRYSEASAQGSFLLAIDQTGYVAEERYKNYFHPEEYELRGEWSILENGSYALLAEFSKDPTRK